MVDCGPACAVPSFASAPTIGFGSSNLGPYGNLGHGGFGFGGFGYGGGALAESANNLGILAGVRPAPINQIPPSEVVIQPPAVNVTLPGPILSATCEPVAVGGNAPCAVGGIGLAGGLGFGHHGFGFGNRSFGDLKGGYLGTRYSHRRRASVCN